tara:strand:- start:89 stop:328 length:240 start_codon:yes stop_codon:yes gene_type:complete
MGRAINMQKDIDAIKIELERLNNIVRGMASELSEVSDIVFEEETTEEIEDVKEETDNQGDGEGDESDDSADGDVDSESK